jgi:L-fuconolactonase
MRKSLLVDSHQHFWDPSRNHYPWMTDQFLAIRRRFGPDDLRPLLLERGIDLTVLVQTRSSLEETREFCALAFATAFVGGVVGWVDLTDPGVSKTLWDLKRSPQGGKLVGIRHQVHDEPDANWLLRGDVRSGLKAVRDAGLSYDFLVRARELPAAFQVARDLGDMHFVIDHMAKPPIRGRWREWEAALAPFAALDNVYCKVSGLVTEAQWSTWHPDDLVPFVQRALDIFGEDRLMFGSDWPVCLVAASYARVFDSLLYALGNVSAQVLAKILGTNALTFYGLGPHLPALDGNLQSSPK